MAGPTPAQLRTRERFEALIGLLAPALDLILAAGDRVSRALGPEDDYYPIRPPGEAFELPAPSAGATDADPKAPGSRARGE